MSEVSLEQVDYVQILYNLINQINLTTNPIKFSQLVDKLDILLLPYYDEEYFKAKKKAFRNLGKPSSYNANNWYWVRGHRLFKILIELMYRKGLIIKQFEVSKV
jgi:hypothetical protein